MKAASNFGKWLVSPIVGSERGHAVVEYAVVIGLVVGAVFFGGQFMRQVSEYEAAQLESHMHHDTHARASTDHDESIDAPASKQPTPGAIHLSADFRLACFGVLAGLTGLGAIVLVVRQWRARNATLKLVGATPEPAKDQPARFALKRKSIYDVLSANIENLLDCQICVRQIMSPRPISVLPKASRAEVLATLLEHKFRHLLVCDEQGRLQGVVSDRDLISKTGHTAKDLMTAKVHTTTGDADIRLVITQMLVKHISSLPVLDDGRLVGIVTITDLLLMLQCTMQLLEHASRQEPLATAN